MSAAMPGAYNESMAMSHLLRRAGNRLAPKVCSVCDGGSGAIHDDSGTLIPCSACNGTGLANPAAERELLASLRAKLSRPADLRETHPD